MFVIFLFFSFPLEHVQLKRLPAQPREARHVSIKGNLPESIVPIAYETTI
jgi:large subunit ribosomal protein L21e